MSWINFFFFVIILNTVTGTVAYLLCKLLTRIAEKAGAIRVIYPMYRLVMIFYTIPFGWIYIYIKCNRVYGSYGIGDSFFGTPIIFWIIQIALIVWLIGMVCVIVRKLKDSYEERKAHELKMKNNMPFRADEYRAMLSRMYPHRNWKRTQFCTNFLTRSPVVVGKFSPVIIIPERKYSEFQIQVILMHEGMHIVRLDNLAKQISSVLIYINWFNPYLKSYTKELDEWADIACDISVCKRFLGGNSKEYYIALMAAKTSGHSVVNPFVSHLNKSNESIKRRMMYMKKWKDSRSKRFVSAILMATLIMGSSVTAFAASSQVAGTQNDGLFRCFRSLIPRVGQRVGQATFRARTREAPPCKKANKIGKKCCKSEGYKSCPACVHIDTFCTAVVNKSYSMETACSDYLRQW